MNLPNRLTVMRMALIPFFLIFMLCDGIPHRYLIAISRTEVTRNSRARMMNVPSVEARPVSRKQINAEKTREEPGPAFRPEINACIRGTYMVSCA